MTLYKCSTPSRIPTPLTRPFAHTEEAAQGGSPSEEGPSQAQSLAQGQVSTTARAQTIVVQLNPTEDASFQTRASFLQTSSKNYITTQTAITRR